MRPEAGSNKAKSGAIVPRANMVEGVRAIVDSL